MRKKNITVEQIFPEKKTLQIKGLYLDHGLVDIAKKLKRPFVLANYVSDINDVIATKDIEGNFQVAKEVKNPSDWGLFLELMAQADIIITGSGYLNRFATNSVNAQDIFSQFGKGENIEELGEWREKNGFEKRNPDIAIISRSLNFDIPEVVKSSDRNIIIFTTKEMSVSIKAKELNTDNVSVIDVGRGGVNGKRMINHLANKGYRVVIMTTGPRILEILLSANVLDRLYVTQVKTKIDYENLGYVKKILSQGGLVKDLPGFTLTHKYIQKVITTETGKQTSQNFLVYDSNKYLGEIRKNKGVFN